jgi:two-component system OmpR family response regulator
VLGQAFYAVFVVSAPPDTSLDDDGRICSHGTMAHILIVEDEDHLAKGIKFNLQAEGYQVTIATDGAQALKSFEEADPPIDLVILDLMLPGMSGYTVCQTLRGQGVQVPLLMLSARTLSEDRTRGFDVGADQYLTKPFELDELLSRIKGLLARHGARQSGERASNSAAHQYVLNRRLIDFDKYEVVFGNSVVRLTPLEIKLLRFFIANGGRVIPRHELLEEVWEQPGHISTRAPDQFMRRLRKLFEDDPSKPHHFLTVRDAGYRFDPS